jgi:hypothetical protein
LIIEPVNRRGLFAARLAEDLRTLCTSRAPFTDSARMLLREGIGPNAILIIRKAGPDYDSLRSTVGAAAKLTVDETRTVFAKWKAFSSSAVAPSIHHSEETPTTLAPAPSALLKAHARTAIKKPAETELGAARPASSVADECTSRPISTTAILVLARAGGARDLPTR